MEKRAARCRLRWWVEERVMVRTRRDGSYELVVVDD